MLAPASVSGERAALEGMPLPRVLALVAGVSGPNLYRVWQPYAELNRQGYTAAQWEFVGDDTNEQRAQLGLPAVSENAVKKVLAFAASGHLDAVILPRMGWPAKHAKQMRSFLRTLKAAGNL